MDFSKPEPSQQVRIFIPSTRTWYLYK
jgi:hypothetical protein